MANLPSLINYGTVAGTIVIAVVDSNDPNSHPDSVPAVGTVTFTPSVPVLVVPDPSNPAVVSLAPISVDLDGTGAFSVELIATDNPAISPFGWTWSIGFDLVGVNLASYSFGVPTGVTTDISSVANSTSLPGTIVVPGPTALYIQPASPGLLTPYVWVQTGLGTDGHGLTIWVEDGL